MNNNTTSQPSIFVPARRLSYDNTGLVYEEKPRSAVVAGYIEAGTEWAVLSEEKGRIIAEREGLRLAFHPNHRVPREIAKALRAEAILAKAHTAGGIGGLSTGQQVEPKFETSIAKAQALANKRMAASKLIEEIDAELLAMRPALQEELDALKAVGLA